MGRKIFSIRETEISSGRLVQRPYRKNILLSFYGLIKYTSLRFTFYWNKNFLVNFYLRNVKGNSKATKKKIAQITISFIQIHYFNVLSIVCVIDN